MLADINALIRHSTTPVLWHKRGLVPQRPRPPGPANATSCFDRHGRGWAARWRPGGPGVHLWRRLERRCACGRKACRHRIACPVVDGGYVLDERVLATPALCSLHLALLLSPRPLLDLILLARAGLDRRYAPGWWRRLSRRSIGSANAEFSNACTKRHAKVVAKKKVAACAPEAHRAFSDLAPGGERGARSRGSEGTAVRPTRTSPERPPPPRGQGPPGRAPKAPQKVWGPKPRRGPHGHHVRGDRFGPLGAWVWRF